MSSAQNALMRAWLRLRAEPVLHFFVLGTLLFVLQRQLVGDPRTIVVTPGLKSELARRFEDQKGRPPSSAELEADLRQWERDEALFREAARRRLDRDDPAIRSVLVGKMQALAASEVSQRAPTDAELAGWLAAHRDRYEAPRRYDFEFFQIPRTESAASSELERLELAIREGANPTTLGRPLLGANLSAADMKDRIPAELAARIPSLPLGQWQRIETEHDLLLARVKRSEGGLPSPDVLRPRLIADWSTSMREEIIERILQSIAARYRIEERR
jgi:hypothetical protein